MSLSMLIIAYLEALILGYYSVVLLLPKDKTIKMGVKNLKF